MPAATLFPSDEGAWAILALLLLYAIYSGGINLSPFTLGALAFIGFFLIGTAQQHH